MSSLEALAAEATKGTAESEEDLDRKVEEALACPCIADIRDGPCGKPFCAAFACYIRKHKSEELSECMPSFTAMHQCMAANPQAFAEYKDNSGEASAEQKG